jgi:hypothetical protein
MNEELTELSEIEKIDNQIKELVKAKKLIKKKMLEEKKIEKKKEYRIKSCGNGGANTIMRVSNLFAIKADKINEKRIENGYERLSNPKITELIIKHKLSWKQIEEDLIYYNTEIEEEKLLYAL